MAHGRAIAKDDKAKGAKHRLFGMVVQEVSLVDRAANKRQFLMTKRDAAMPTTKKNATAVAKGPEQGAAESAAAAAGAKPGGGPDGAGAPTQGGGDSPAGGDGKLPALQPQVKDQVLQTLTGLAEKLVDVMDQVKDADTDDKAGGGALPDSVASALREVSTGLTGLVGDGAQKADLGGVTENGGVAAQGSQKAAELEKLLLGMVTKRGAKMAKERRMRLGQAISALTRIHRELKTAKGAKIEKRAGVVNYDKALNDLTDLVTVVTKRSDDALEALTKRDKTIADQAARIVELEKRTGVPNSLVPEGAGGGGGGGAHVVWPTDMNSKPKTTPATSFAGSGG